MIQFKKLIEISQQNESVNNERSMSLHVIFKHTITQLNNNNVYKIINAHKVAILIVW